MAVDVDNSKIRHFSSPFAQDLFHNCRIDHAIERRIGLALLIEHGFDRFRQGARIGVLAIKAAFLGAHVSRNPNDLEETAMRTLSGARSAAAPRAARHAKSNKEIRMVNKPAGIVSVFCIQRSERLQGN